MFFGLGGNDLGAWEGPVKNPGSWCDVAGRCPHDEWRVAMSSGGGWNHGHESHIFWNQDKLGPNDNIYIRNHNEGDTVRVITNVKPTGSGWTPPYDATDSIIGSRHGYITHFTLKKDDKPVKGSGELEYLINTRPFTEHGAGNAYLTKDVWDDGGYKNVPLADGGKGDPCPGAPANKKGFFNRNQIKCVYNKDSLGRLGGASRSPDQDAMYNKLLSDYCNTPGNETHTVGSVKCTDNSKFMAVAQRYCESGTNIKDASKDAICGPTNYGKYHESAINYCNKNPTDNWCRCYTALKKCTTDMNGPGCQKFKTVFDSYKKFQGKPGYTEAVNAIPCAAGCSLADVYRPRDIGTCPTSITICNADVNVGSMQDSSVKVEQACSSGDAPSTDPKAGSGGGGGGGGGGEGEGEGEGEEETLIIPKNLADFKTFIPTGVEGLKTSKRQQAGVGVVGAGLMMMCLVLLLLVVSGGGGAAPRRFRR